MESDTLTNLLIDDKPLNDLIQATSLERLSVVPSDTSLAGVEQVLANRIGRETILRQALESAKVDERFDFVLFDCPPSLGVLSANALVAADYVVIPMQAEYLSLQEKFEGFLGSRNFVCTSASEIGDFFWKSVQI